LRAAPALALEAWLHGYKMMKQIIFKTTI